MRRQRVGHARSGHAPGKGFGGLVFVHQLPGFGRVFADSHVEPPHLLEAADVAYRNALPGPELRPLEDAGLDAGHVMRRRLAHGFLHRDHPRGGGRRHIGRFALTAPADGAVLPGIGLAALRADADNAHVAVPKKAAFHGYGLDLADGVPGAFDLIEKTRLVLFLLGLFLEEPAADFREGVKPGGIDAHAHALARMLVEERHGVAPQIVHLHPVVARAAQGKELYGIGQAFTRFHHRLEERPLRDARLGKLDHIAADEQPRGGVAVKILGKSLEFLKGIRSDIHPLSLLVKVQALKYVLPGALSAEKGPPRAGRPSLRPS